MMTDEFKKEVETLAHQAYRQGGLDVFDTLIQGMQDISTRIDSFPMDKLLVTLNDGRTSWIESNEEEHDNS